MNLLSITYKLRGSFVLCTRVSTAYARTSYETSSSLKGYKSVRTVNNIVKSTSIRVIIS